ncbi:cell wall hydrolase [uncultured Rhodoblastus sp.]|uniref:cell wall hydrolase n=1 Tax=uncultured Rhodoblastus sp. TaxID=543037 RepID=UPI0025DD869D|nr:cell wall hydrolase [uncultured Rhodoblastus sp.]
MLKARRKAHLTLARYALRRLAWASEAAAPWCVAAALLVSFTAEAGQEVPSGASMAPLSVAAAVMPQQLAPPVRSLATPFGENFGRGLLREARLAIGAPEQFDGEPDEIEPRADLKKNAKNFPQIDRSHKGDPIVGLRPTLDGRWRQKGGLAKIQAEFLAFGQDENGVVSSFAPGADLVAGFEAWPVGESPAAQPSRAAISPNQGGGALTMRPAALAERLAQGATPATPRAAALGSSTPVAGDQIPVEAFASLIAPPPARPAATGDRGRYLALIAPQQLEAEKQCLAQAIYFEARSEPEQGQAAVAQVILNRMTSGLYPTTICGVVYQNRRHYRGCQFSFACEGKSLRVREGDSWAQATRIADDVLGGKTWLADVGDSTHYHADYVKPRWARALKKMDVIGKHVFYRLKPGQS